MEKQNSEKKYLATPLLARLARLVSFVSGNRSIHAPHSREQQTHHRHLDQRFAGLHLPLVVFAHSSIARYPAECSLYYPPFGHDAEPTGTWRALDYFEIPLAGGLAPSSQLLAPIRRIGPDFDQARDKVLQSSEQTARSSCVMHIGFGHIDGKRNVQSIDEDMPLAPLDSFVRIKAADPSGLFHRFDALGIQNGRTRMGIPALSFAFGSVQGAQQECPDALETQTSEMIEDGLSWRKIGGQVAPRTASA